MKKAIPFFISQAITLFGSQIVSFAIIWYITLETTSGLWVSLLTICSFVPQFLMSFFGGALADRHSKKALIVGADAAIAAFTLALALLMPVFSEGGTLRIALLVIAALRSVAAGIQTPAVNAAIPLLVGQDKLMKANGINSTLQSIANFAAPAAAGAVMSLMSLRWSLMIDVATAVAGIAILSFILIPEIKAESAVRGGSGFFRDIAEGIRYAASNRTVGGILLLFGAFIFLSVPAGFLANLFTARYFCDTYVHLMSVEIVGFAGMMAGGILMSTWGGFRSRFHTLLASAVLFGAVGLVMGLSEGFVLYLAMMFLYGIPLSSFQASVTTILQENADEGMLGRVFGLLNAMYSGFLPVGMAVFGPLADAVSLRVLIIAGNVALLLVCVPVVLKLAAANAGRGHVAS
ncbi:MAG: MFS transporter [Candidatus Cryptobacteroides sp.]